MRIDFYVALHLGAATAFLRRIMYCAPGVLHIRGASVQFFKSCF